jgi:hypothetical protein
LATLDGLWPLWDYGERALHDMPAGTRVKMSSAAQKREAEHVNGREAITLRSVSTRAAKSSVRVGATRSTRRLLVWLATIASVLLVCGCGVAATSALTHTQFVSRADAICAEAVNAGQELHQPKSRPELLPFLERAGPIVARGISELKDVKPPSDVRAAYDRFLATTAHEVRSLGELTQALRTKNVPQEHVALQALNSNSANEQAQALGLTECARTVTPRGSP